MLKFYTFAAFGLAYIVGQSKISLPIRKWLHKGSPWIVDLLECPACFGFWTGTLLGGPILGCYTAGTNYCLWQVTEKDLKPQ